MQVTLSDETGIYEFQEIFKRQNFLAKKLVFTHILNLYNLLANLLCKAIPL